MRNRAKCKVCGEILESFHKNDEVECKCGEISISGGNYEFKAYAKNWSNFLRIDDNENEIIPKIVNPEDKVEKTEAPTRDELLYMLKNLSQSLEELPPFAMSQAINHYDFQRLIIILYEILKEK